MMSKVPCSSKYMEKTFELSEDEVSKLLENFSLTPKSKPLQVNGDPHFGCPILLKGLGDVKQPQIPFARQSTSTFTISGAVDGNTFDYEVLKISDERFLSYKTYQSSWQQEINGILMAQDPSKSTPKVTVVGSKNVGKSTLVKILVNNLLNNFNSVAILDTDVGQPIGTPPGIMSISVIKEPIYGPSHLTQFSPDMSYFFGDVTPQTNPQLCFEIINNLFAWYLKHKSDIPLIVNTHGWIQGVGLDTIVKVLQTINPTLVCFLNVSNQRRNLANDAFWLQEKDTRKNEIQIKSFIGLEGTKGMAAVDIRNLNWLSFSCEVLGIRIPPNISNSVDQQVIAEKLAIKTPYALNFNDVKIQILHSHIEPAYVTSLLDCTFVGLATSTLLEDDKGDCHSSKNLQCIGVGFVRSIDALKGKIYILTNLSLQNLRIVNVIQVGKLSTPNMLLQSSHFSSPYLNNWSIGSEGSGSGVLKSRNTLTRSSQLRP